ncbi:MAG: PatB family C-S lyase [Clostridium sp.]
MVYNFDEIIDRTNNNAAKYDERKKKFGTDDVIPLWIADMDFRVPKPVEDALIDKAGQGMFGYVSRPEEYWDSLCRWQKKKNNWDIDPSLLSFSCGVVPSLAALVRQFSNEGEEILIQTPVYPEFYEVVENANRNVLVSRLVETDGNYAIDFADFEAKLKRGPKAFILCNPQNPVGRAWKKAELKQMGDLCVRYHVPILSDEIHGDLMLWGNKHTPMAAISPAIAANTITCTAVSKTFNLAGLQASSVIFNNKEERNKFEKFWHDLEIHRNNCFSLVASIAAYNEGEEWLDQLLSYLEGNMQFVHDYCENYIPSIKARLPECTYLMWLDCRGLHKTDEELNDFMIKEAKIGLNAGCDFDRELSGFMRLNTACPRSVLEQAMNRLKAAVEK